MSPTFRTDIRDRIPLPLAQLYRRTANAKTWIERQLNAFYLLEAALKLAASAQVAIYLRSGRRDPRLDAALRNLALPSLGQWVGFLRDTAGFNARLVEHPFPALAGIDRIIHAEQDLPAVRALLVAMGEHVETMPAFTSPKVRVLDLLERLVTYRNQTLGHGAQRDEAFHEPMADDLIAAAVELFEKAPFFGDAVLVFVSEVHENADRTTAVELWDLTGRDALLLTPPGGSSEWTAAGLEAGHLYLKKGSAFLDLDPFVVCQPLPPEAQVLFLNRSRIERRVEYLNYVTGETTIAPHLIDNHRRVLGAVLGRAVDTGELRALQDASASDGDVPAAASQPSGPPPERFGDFDLIGRLGTGGMGEVFLARQLSLNRLVALKLLPPALADDEVAAARFQREVRALSQADHPNVVRILQSGKTGSSWWYAMELVDGADLGAVSRALPASSSRGDLGAADLARAVTTGAERTRAGVSKAGLPAAGPGPVPQLGAGRSYFDRIAEIFEEAALGVQHLHERQIIHRDLKPSNIMLSRGDGRAVVMDLGLAHIGGEVTLTRPDRVLGTIRYAAPEQLASAETRSRVDARTDVYGLGASLYELATGRPAYAGDDEKQLVAAIMREDPPPPHKIDRSVPADLAAIIRKAMARERADRYQTALDLADDLRAFREGRPIVARPLSSFRRVGRWVRREPAKATLAIVVVLAVVAGALAAAFWLGKRDDMRRGERAAAQERLDALLEPGFLEIEGRPEAAVETFRRALEMEPRSDEALAGLVLSQLALNDPRAAREALAAHQGPENLRTVEWLRAEILRDEGKLSEASELLRTLPPAATSVEHFLAALAAIRRGQTGFESAYDQAIEELMQASLLSSRPLFSFWLAYIAEQVGDSRVCRLVARVLLERSGHSPIALRYAGLALSRVEPEAAIQAFRAALDHERGESAGATALGVRGAILVGIGNAQAQTGDLEGAIDAYRGTVDLLPAYAPAYVRLADALQKSGDPDAAVRFLRRATDEWKGTAKLHAALGAHLFMTGKLKEAIDSFRTSLQINPQQPFEWSALVFTVIRLKFLQPAEAMKEAKAGAAAYPDSAYTQIALGCAAAMNGEPPIAMAALKRGFELNPSVAREFPYVHRAFAGLDPFFAGVLEARIRAVLNVDPSFAPAHVFLGIALRAKGKTADAIAAFTRATELNPGLEWAHFNLGAIRIENAEYAEAVQALRRAVAVAPRSSESWRFFGIALRNHGDPVGAVEAFGRALAIAPSDDQAQYGLALALAEAREFTRARVAIDGLASRHPRDPDAWEKVATFLSGPSTSAQLLDPRAAVAAARKAVELSKRGRPTCLDALAQALFQAGSATEAVAAGEEAIRVAETRPGPKYRGLVPELRASLDRYRAAASRPASESR